MTAIRHQRVGNVLICVHHVEGDPQEFEEVVHAIKDLPTPMRVLVARPPRKPPNALQRRAMNEVMKGKNTRVALLTKSRVVRGAATVFSWLGTVDAKGFSEHDLVGALAFLEADVDAEHVEAVARELCAELDQTARVAQG